MPTVAPQARPTAETSRPSEAQPLTQESFTPRNEPSALRKYAGIAAMSMALTNSERLNAQSPIAPTPPPGYQAYGDAQLANGQTVKAPVLSAIPQGYVVVSDNRLPTYQTQPAPIAQSTLPVYSAPQNQVAGTPTQPSVASQPQGHFQGGVPVVGGTHGVMPQGELRVVSPGVGHNGGAASQVVGQQVVHSAPQITAPPLVTAPGYNPTIPNVAQAQMDYSAARIRANSHGNAELDQARLNLEAARLAEQQQIRAAREAERQAIMAQREQMRYNADAQRYHYRRAQDIGWALDAVLPSSVPGPWVKPVPPRQPR